MRASDIAWVANTVACYGDSGSIWVSFFGADLADHIAVTDFFETIGRNIGVVNDVKGVGSIYRRFGGVFAFEALTETT